MVVMICIALKFRVWVVEDEDIDDGLAKNSYSKGMDGDEEEALKFVIWKNREELVAAEDMLCDEGTKVNRVN